MNMNYSARNLNEELVDALLDEHMARVDMCRCSRCRADVRAFALNLIPPRYVVTTEGYIYSRMQSLTCQNQADILAAVSRAVSVVSGRPRHPTAADYAAIRAAAEAGSYSDTTEEE